MQSHSMIPFNKPYLTGNELDYIAEAANLGQLAGDGLFTEKCRKWLQNNIGCDEALLTPSCTAALEMAALLIDTQQGDEIIMPSYTFVSTANAFVLQGGVPVFIDVKRNTLNIDESLIEAAITPKTKAIVVVHYAGLACEMDQIVKIARKHNLYLIEDAAQGIMSKYKGSPLGSFGDLACLSFHETKNIVSGEGGALLINNSKFTERAEIIRQKGTDRDKYFRGQVDKYSWQEAGSSFLPGEIIAAFLWAQLEQAESISSKRLAIWEFYTRFFRDIDSHRISFAGDAPLDCKINGHIFYALLDDIIARDHFINKMRDKGVYCAFHYVPLHNSEAGKKFGRIGSSMEVTENISERLVRLPVWLGVNKEQVTESALSVISLLEQQHPS